MVGTTLNDRYHLESELGHGGMGVVYRARDLALNRMVAVKVLPPEFTLDEQFLLRFNHEVLNVARLDHPNIVSIYDVGQDANIHFYIMQMVEGGDLHSEILRRGRFSLQETIQIINQVSVALDYAHEQGIVHRDIKPDNILLDRKGSPRVVDFGIAKTIEGTRMTGGMIGTPEYMSPEQARGEALDGRADQYALAIVAYEMLTGTTPFRSDTAQAWSLVNAHITIQPPDPRQWIADLPDYVANSLMQALAKAPASRFATCAQFAAALEDHAQPTLPQMPSVAPHPPDQPARQLQSMPPPAPRSPLGLQGILAALVGVLLLGGGWLVLGQRTLKKDTHSVAPPSPVNIAIPVSNPTPRIKAPAAPDIPKRENHPAKPASNSHGRWAWTAERAITGNDLQGMSAMDLELMRNEIYARHGWIFKRKDLQDYFTAQHWYTPAGPPTQRDTIDQHLDTEITPLEKQNAARIINFEKALKGQ